MYNSENANHYNGKYMKYLVGFWPLAVLFAFIRVIGALTYLKPHHPNYFINLFYYTDILGNAFSAGNALVTVSARLGLIARTYSTKVDSWVKSFWLFSEKVVNESFYPIDGEGHCWQAAEWTLKEIKVNGKPVNIHEGPVVGLIVLTLIVTVSCIVLYPLIRLLHKLRLL